MRRQKMPLVLSCLLASLAAVGLPQSAHAFPTYFDFDFTMNDPALQSILDANGGSSGVVRLSGPVEAGDHTLDSLGGLDLSFTLGATTFTLPDLSDDPSSVALRVVGGSSGSQQITQVRDLVGSFAQFFVDGNQHALSFPRTDGQFRLGDRALFPNTSINNIGTFTATKRVRSEFTFDFVMDDPALQAILDANGGSSGELSFNGLLPAGDHTLDSLGDLDIAFTLGATTFTLADLSDDPSGIAIRIVGDPGEGQEIVQIRDLVGSFTQFFVDGNQHALSFPRTDGQFRLGDRDLFPNTSINNIGTFAATAPVPEPSSLGLLLVAIAGGGLMPIRRRRIAV